MTTQEEYNSAIPFPHIVCEAPFALSRLKECEREVNLLSGIEKNVYHTRGKSVFSPVDTELGKETLSLLNEMNSAKFLKFLESITGIEGLIPDPYYEGGGVHKTSQGGFLKMHADFNWHKKLKLDRRINLLLYLNSEWKEEWGGHLEFWDNKKCCLKVLPTLGRMVIFNTTDYSLHGHPEPLTCPNGNTRNSIAIYYYTSGRPSSERRRGKHVHTLYDTTRIPRWLYSLRDFLRRH